MNLVKIEKVDGMLKLVDTEGKPVTTHTFRSFAEVRRFAHCKKLHVITAEQNENKDTQGE